MKQFVQQKVAAAERQAGRHKRTIEALQAQLMCVVLSSSLQCVRVDSGMREMVLIRPPPRPSHE